MPVMHIATQKNKREQIFGCFNEFKCIKNKFVKTKEDHIVYDFKRENVFSASLTEERSRIIY